MDVGTRTCVDRGSVALHWCISLRVTQVELGLFQDRPGSVKLSLGRCEGILSILKFLFRSNPSLKQVGFSIEILLFLDEVGFPVGNGRLGGIQRRLVIGRIEFKQKIAGLYLLIVVNWNVDNRAGNARRDTNDLCPRLTISTPRTGDNLLV